MKNFLIIMIITAILPNCSIKHNSQNDNNLTIYDSSRTENKVFLSDSIYQNEPYKIVPNNLPPATFWFRIDDQELPIVERLPLDELYLINNYPTIGQSYSNIIIKRDNQVIYLGQYAIEIYQGGTALIEGKNISLQHEGNAKTNAIGQYALVDFDSNNYISGSWKFNGNSGPSLIADLKSPRHFRISIDKIVPTLQPNQKFEFIVYIDNTQISDRLINTTSIDVYGSKIYIFLVSWSPVGSFVVHGSYVSW